MTPKVTIHIDRLILEGFEPAHRNHLGEAVQQELARLFTEQGIPPSLSASWRTPHVTGVEFTTAPDASANRLGAQIARSLYGGLHR